MKKSEVYFIEPPDGGYPISNIVRFFKQISNIVHQNEPNIGIVSELWCEDNKIQWKLS